ncbi:hypothetical protein Leryth_001268 [Lithospermum erythrorhizon]|nr:hypothetical protein Leryth_001268 [Lithospermum erythrorhizon]
MFVIMVIVFGFVLGVVAVLVVEAVGVVLLMRWLNRKTEKEERKLNYSDTATVPDQSFFCNKQGNVWILESTKIPKGWPFDKVAKEQRPKNEFLEVTPVRKHAKIKDQYLILTEPDGSLTKIQLKGCKIEAVSASGMPSRKWAKRFPVKIEGKESEIYKGCKIVFVYLETAWEKESWCKALRLASYDDKEKRNWVTKLSIDFHNYVTSLNTEYPSFIKPSMVSSADPSDKSLRNDVSSSKVKQFLKKLAKKGSKRDIEVKASSIPIERKRTVRSYSYGDSAGWERMLPPAKPYNAEGNKSSSSSVTTGNEGQLSTIYDKDSDDKIFSDEGTLCWNLLISRLFFDAKNNMQMKTALQSRIQRMLSNMRSPSYIGEITCTSTDTGNVPPHIHGMRVLASNTNEVWAFEIDIEYAGGAVLGVETRLEVGELDAQEAEELNNESSPMGEVTSDLLEGIEYYGKQLNISEDAAADMVQKNERDPKPDDSRGCKMITRVSSQVPKWKSMLHSVAKHVSQIPLALGIKVTSLRGTMRLYIKPPPSDEIWFGFTTMPEVDFSLESYVGDHKVTSGHLAVFLISRFKAAIRETLVLPNCENLYIPWMLAEKDDWVPRKAAPYMWIHQDSGADNTTNRQEVPGSRLGNVVNEVVNNTAKQGAQGSQPGTLGSKIDQAPSTSQDVKQDESVKVGYSGAHTRSESSESCSHSAPTPLSSSNDHLPDHLSTVPVENDKSLENPPSISSHGTVESCVTSRSVSFSDGLSQSIENDEMKPQRLGTKAKMLGFRKKVGEKLEEKRRSLEEKGKNIVEKMRESKLNN